MLRLAGNQILFKESGFFFIALIGLVLLGFSKTYFFQLDESFPLAIHLHVLFLGTWVLLVTGQAFLIRGGQRSVHRQLGELSYLLVPMIIISGIYLARAQFHIRAGTVGLTDNMEFLWWAVTQFVLFGVLYMLAMIHRKKMMLHARYMIAATLLFVSPALLRTFDLLGLRLANLSQLDLSFIITDLILIALLVNDFRKRQTLVPFSVALAGFVFVQIGVKFANQNPAWRFIADIIVDL